MIGVAMYITIKSLWEKHKNKSLIARMTGHDWKTVAKRIKEIEQDKEYQKKKPHPRILDSCKEQIIKYLEEELVAWTGQFLDFSWLHQNLLFCYFRDYNKLIKY